MIALEWSALVEHLKATILPTESEKNLAMTLQVAVSYLQPTAANGEVYGPLMRIIDGTSIPEDWAMIAKAASKRD